LASADATALWAVRRELLQPDALPKAAFPFLGRAVAVVLQAVVAVVQGAPLETGSPSVQQVQPRESE